MDWIWYAADYPSKQKEVQISTYQSLTGNEWLDLLLVVVPLLLFCSFIIWHIERKN